MKTNTTNTEAVEIMIQSHRDLRHQLKQAIRLQEDKISGFRKNINPAKRQEADRYLNVLQEKLAHTEETIHQLDSLHTVIDEYVEVNNQIADLCNKRRGLCPSGLLQSMFTMTKRDGCCVAH